MGRQNRNVRLNEQLKRRWPAAPSSAWLMMGELKFSHSLGQKQSFTCKVNLLRCPCNCRSAEPRRQRGLEFFQMFLPLLGKNNQ